MLLFKCLFCFCKIRSNPTRVLFQTASTLTTLGGQKKKERKMIRWVIKMHAG